MQILNIVLYLLTAFIVLVLINDYYQNKKELWKIENKNGTFDNPITEGFLYLQNLANIKT